MLVNLEAMQVCPIDDLVARSHDQPEHTILPMASGFMRYILVNGDMQYRGTVDYRQISLQ